ncbi:MAG: hypothetical protein J0H08_05260 [Rhizobiales bacterium]|jgi:hypothetical protein|nr:hypothetical protein [Hyphomicrobiales bacterium]
MNTQKKTIDRRPFQSKADIERQQNLADQYRSVAIPEVVAALRRTPAKADEQVSAG